MNFLNPAFLFALTASAVPLLIHLLSRRRTREVPFSSLRFLERSDRKSMRRINLRRLILLALRTAAIALIALAFEAISVAEKQHGKRYTDLANNLEEGRVFKRNGKVVWRCRNCGYLHEGEDAPDLCPACLHPQAHFELLGENW